MREHAVFHPIEGPRMLTHGGSVARRAGLTDGLRALVGAGRARRFGSKIGI